jgi:hypothetical protein
MSAAASQPGKPRQHLVCSVTRAAPGNIWQPAEQQPAQGHILMILRRTGNSPVKFERADKDGTQAERSLAVVFSEGQGFGVPQMLSCVGSSSVANQQSHKPSLISPGNKLQPSIS